MTLASFFNHVHWNSLAQRVLSNLNQSPGCQGQQGQRANRPKLAPKAEEVTATTGGN